MRLTTRDLHRLREYPWPGNVRQLTKLLNRAAFLEISLETALEEERDLGELPVGTSDACSLELLLARSPIEIQTMRNIQHTYARHVWKLLGENYTATARALEVDVNTLRYNYLEEVRSRK